MSNSKKPPMKALLILETTQQLLSAMRQEDTEKHNKHIPSVSRWLEHELVLPFYNLNQLTGLNMRQLLAVVKTDKFKKLTLELESELAA